MTHAKTPWTIARVHDMGGTRLEIINTHPRHGEPTPIAVIYKTDGEGKANAEFIVRAANAHDELLAACKALLAQSWQMGTADIDYQNDPIRADMAKRDAFAAITKAEGGK